LVVKSAPLEDAFFPSVDVGDGERSHEDQHDAEHRVAELDGKTASVCIDVGAGRPGVEVEEFDVEDEEQDGDEVEFDVACPIRRAFPW
jgi:hypothetical protein